MQLLVCIALLALGAAQEPLAGVPMAIAPNANTTAPNATGAALAPDSPGVDAGGVVIKTWGFLRETTDALGSHTQDVLAVKKDLADMAADIAEQRRTWAAAAEAMATENRALQAQVATARATPVKDHTAVVAQLESSLSHAREQTRVARLNQTTAKLVWEGKEKQHLAQIQALNQRITQVNTETALAQESAQRSLNAAQLSKHALQTQVQQLQDQIAALKVKEAQLEQQAQHNVTLLQDQQAFLAKQLQSVQLDLPKIQAEVTKGASLQQQIFTGQGELAQVQAQLATSQGECGTHLAELHDVIRAEQAKVAARSSEVARCSSVGAQNAWLEQQIAQKCPSSSAMSA